MDRPDFTAVANRTGYETARWEQAYEKLRDGVPSGEFAACWVTLRNGVSLHRGDPVEWADAIIRVLGSRG